MSSSVTITPLAEFSRLQLARLCRELMLAAQFNSRTGYAALRINHGDAAYKDTAIQNWMGASPVYTRRMQQTLGFAGGADVPTIFKGLQLDVGFTHQYFDVHFEVHSAQEGRFWLRSCGALLEAEPRGEEAVKVMCHDIEDPTFDATAMATNPRARMRPVHRPPRAPVDREPHCEWRVFIDEQAEPLVEPPIAETMAATRLGQLPIKKPPQDGAGGLTAYDGQVQEQLHLECFSHSALLAIYSELAVQIHLLINALLLVVTETYGAEAAQAVAEFQMCGTSWVVSERLKALLAQDIDDADGIQMMMAVLALHPAFKPDNYINYSVEVTGQRSARLTLGDCQAAQEALPCTWYALLARGIDSGLQALVQGVNRCATISPVANTALCWDIEITDTDQVQEEPFAVQVAKGTVLYQTQLDDHIQVLQL